MRSRPLVAFAALVAATCSGGPDEVIPPDADPRTAFDLDIEVHPYATWIWLRERFETPCVPEEVFPHPGECATYSDGFACAGTLGTCLTRVAIESDGVVLGEGRLFEWWRAIFVRADLPETPSQLVIEGCGGSQVFALPTPITFRPRLLDVTTDGSYLIGTIEAAAGTTGTLASLGSIACHQPGADMWTVPSSSFPRELSVAAVRRAEPTLTPWGEASIWSMTQPLAPTPILAPQREASGLWRVGAGEPASWSVQVDGAPYTDDRWTDRTWRFRTTDDGPRHQLSSGPLFMYEAGDTTDQLRVLLTTGFHSGTFPHAAPGDELEFSVGDNGHFALTVGPVPLTNELYPALTRDVTLTVAWDHPLVARPLP